MKRIQYLSVLELFQGIKFYETDSLNAILENHLQVPQGRNGILIKLEGSYRLSANPQECGEAKIIIKNRKSEIISKQKGSIYDHSYAQLQQFPYESGKLDLQIHPQILDEVFPIKNGLEKKCLYNPMLLHNQSNPSLFHLIDFYDTLNSNGDGRKLEHKLWKTQGGF